MICLALTIATAITFWPLHSNGFTNYDDDDYITENWHVRRGLNLEDVKWAFTTGYTGYPHPLTWLTHQLDYQLFGLWAGGHHLTSLVIHITNSLLLFLLFWRLTRSLWRSAFVAGVFAIHPLHVESVAWSAERKDVLCGLFWMLSLHSYISYTRKLRAASYLLTFFLFLLGLLSKPMIVTLPFVLLLIDYWPLRRLRSTEQVPRLILEKVPFFVLSVAWSIVTWIAAKHAATIVSIENTSLVRRLANTILSYFNYISKAIWPTNLAVFYPYPKVFHVLAICLAVLALIVITALAIRRAKTRPYLFVGWFWFIGVLLPVSGIFQAGAQAMADRYTYIPLIGLATIAAWGLPDLIRTFPITNRTQLIAGGAGAVLVLTTWMVLANQTANQWRNSVTLFAHALTVTSGNWLAHNNLGSALLDEPGNNVAMAKEHVAEALKLRGPNYPEGQLNLGAVLLREGKISEAIPHLEKALELRPDWSVVHNNLGLAFAKQKRLDEAIAQYRKTLELEPHDTICRNNLGMAFLQKEVIDEAIAQFRQVVAIEPKDVQAHYQLANCLFQKGQVEEAIRHWQQGIALRPESAEIRNNLAVGLLRAGRPKDAIAQWQKIVEIQPENPAARTSIAWVLATSSDDSVRTGEKALQLAQEAQKLSKEQNAILFRTLAAASAECGRFDDAVMIAQKALPLAKTNELRNQLESEIKLYQAHAPLRDTGENSVTPQ